MSPDLYLKQNKVKKLHLGCGTRLLSGWINADQSTATDGVFYMNLAGKWLFDDNVFDYAFSDHVIEHLTYQQGIHFLYETYRVLKPGGKMRITCPDFDFFIRLYTNPTTQDQTYIERCTPDWASHPSAIFVFNNSVRDWGHQFIYNRGLLRDEIEYAGFINIEEKNIGESDDINLKKLENEHRPNLEFVRMESMTFEATKPLTKIQGEV